LKYLRCRCRECGNIVGRVDVHLEGGGSSRDGSLWMAPRWTLVVGNLRSSVETQGSTPARCRCGRDIALDHDEVLRLLDRGLRFDESGEKVQRTYHA
jgi:hypothetical protein